MPSPPAQRRRVGPYEIHALLGQGGMGEVYRGHDTRLKRDVALKVLPQSVAADEERVARFEREAQTLAALNHQHIAALHGIEESNGTLTLVMELVEGPTLAERIAEGPIPLDEALPIVRQIAEALSAAHEAGIVHRDLKPANIKLRSDGTVKVLDFGLAKALEPRAPAGDITSSPTFTSPAIMTHAGMILGTAAYMSPEQARGKAVDKRTDIWAFGCVLFEMLTGTPAFSADTVTDTLAKVLRERPDWGLLPENVSGPVRALIEDCLATDQRQRLSDISIARFVIDRHADLMHDVPARWHEPRRFAVTHLAAALIVAVAVTAAAVWLWMRPPTSDPVVVRTSVVTTGGAILQPSGFDVDLAITPDGRQIVYRGREGLLRRSLDQFEVDRIVVSDARQPFVSPDGQWVGFFHASGNLTGSLKKVAMTGGPATELVSALRAPRGASWGASGVIVYGTTDEATGLIRVSADGGDPTVLTTPDLAKGELDHVWPEFLPNRSAVLFTITARDSSTQIAVVDVETRVIKTVLRGGTHGRYVPSGHLVYAVGNTLRAAPFSLDRLELIGAPIQVLDRVLAANTGTLNATVSVNGTLVYVPGGPVGHSLVWVDESGKEDETGAPPRAYTDARLSPDGTQALLQIRDQNADLFIWHFANRTLTPITSQPLMDVGGAWSADGKRVIYATIRGAGTQLFTVNANGTAPPEALGPAYEEMRFPQVTTRDGRLIFQQVIRETNNDIFITGSDGARGRPLIQNTAHDMAPALSVDEKWIAYQTEVSGKPEVFVQPFPEVAVGRSQVSSGGGRTPLWGRDGRSLFYVSSDEHMMRVLFAAGPTWQASTPHRLFSTARYALGPIGRGFDVAQDGRFLVIKNLSATNRDTWELAVVQNWQEELKRLAPVR